MSSAGRASGRGRAAVVLAACVIVSAWSWGCSGGGGPGGGADTDADADADGGAADGVAAADAPAGSDAAVPRDGGEDGGPGACADVSCPASPAPCLPNVCDPATGRCGAAALPKDTPCEADDDPCTLDACDERGLCQRVGYDEGAPGCPGPECAAAEACANGVDDDCDGVTDCADGECLAEPACRAVCGPPLAALACGDVAPAARTTEGGVAAYSCAAVPHMPGPEAVWAFTPAADGLVRLTVTAEPAAYAWVLLLADECAGARCAAATWLGGADETLIAAVQGGVTYHAVVDASVGGVLAVAGVWLECSAGEVCANGADDDWDALVDCADPDCAGGAPCEPTEASCLDAFDNDADGRTDCADGDCDGVGPCEAAESDCTDAFDNDADGRTDCADESCLPAAVCLTPCADAVVPIACGFAADSLTRTTQSFVASPCAEGSWLMPDAVLAFVAEASGTVRLDLLHTHEALLVTVLEGDCAAARCLGTWRPEPYHVVRAAEFEVVEGARYLVVVDAATPLGAPLNLESVALTCGAAEVCDDDVDNDWDGETDCADADCLAAGPPCESPEASCADGRDNDGDGRGDCADPDCVAAGPPCEGAEASCADGGDNDGDGLVDCADPDCGAEGGCVTACVGAPVVIACGFQASLDDDGPVSGGLAVSVCLGVPTPGNERVYAFTPTADGAVVFEVSGAAADGRVALTLHEGRCATDTCVGWPAAGGDPGVLEAQVTGGVEYWFVVDSTRSGAPGGERVRLTCGP